MPIYAADAAVAHTKGEIETAAQSGEPAFLRRSYLCCLGANSLKQALDFADTALTEAAEATNTELVPYTWGLHQNDTPLPPAYSLHLPKGYHLVAKVDAITDLVPMERTERDRIDQAITRHDEAVPVGIYMLDELFTWQCIRQAKADEPRRTWLVDVDAKLIRKGVPRRTR